MQTILKQSFNIGTLQLPHRLLQGPLAGYSCAPFRELFYQFTAPAYCVSEMLSAYDVLHKHTIASRYLYRGKTEKRLCYQLAGHDPMMMAQAALRLSDLGADLIDINSGCPKAKIRKKGAGSALLDKPILLANIVSAIKQVIDIPLTVKMRLCKDERDIILAKLLEGAGADGLIVHGRRWTEDYNIPCDLMAIRQIKDAVSIPVIANGDIEDHDTLRQAISTSTCDAYMISRAGTGSPWLYQQLLTPAEKTMSPTLRNVSYLTHLQGLATLETEYQAVLQSKSLARYYFGKDWHSERFTKFYQLNSLREIERFISNKSKQ